MRNVLAKLMKAEDDLSPFPVAQECINQIVLMKLTEFFKGKLLHCLGLEESECLVNSCCPPREPLSPTSD